MSLISPATGSLHNGGLPHGDAHLTATATSPCHSMSQLHKILIFPPQWVPGSLAVVEAEVAEVAALHLDSFASQKDLDREAQPKLSVHRLFNPHAICTGQTFFSAFKTMMSQPTCHMELMERAKRMHSCNLAQPQNCFGANIKNHKPLQVRNRSTSTQIVSASEGPKGNQQWFQKRLSQDPFRAKDARRPRKATGHNGSNQVCCLLRGGFESAIGNPWQSMAPF